VTADAEQPRARLLRIGRDTGLFIAGFSAVFIALGLPATSAGRLLARHHAMLTRLAGLVVLGLALFLAVFRPGRHPRADGCEVPAR
jgi:cytochrome c-type biogenesis protein